VGLAPLTLALFQQASLIAPIANAVAIPVVTLGIVPLALLGIGVPVTTPFDGAHALLALLMHFLESLAALPDATWQQHAPLPWTVAAGIAGTLWLLAPRGLPGRAWGLVWLLPLFIVRPAPPPHGGFRLTVLDVGQGLSAIIETHGRTLVYDAGPRFSETADAGGRIVAPFLRAAGLRRADGLVISHQDLDHSGGTLSLMQATPVGWFASSLPADHAIVVRAQARAESADTVMACIAGQRWHWDGVDFTMLHPTRAEYDDSQGKTNDRSCVVRVDSYDDVPGALAAQLRGLGFRCAVAAPIMLGGRLWGAVIVSSVRPGAFAAGDEVRISSFAELVAQALANAEARELLAASRRRIVQAGDEERRRLERNLHDGAQQRLVALALTVRMVERKLQSDPETACRMLAHAGTELDQALAELREIARGLHPAVLTDRGLGPALDALATRAPIPVDVAGAVDARLPAPVEAAAYYVVAEALTNVAKYAQASEARIDLRRDDGRLVVEVADDGVGGADASRGSGLRGLADRVEALGGRLEVSSPEGGGTTLRATLPCLSG